MSVEFRTLIRGFMCVGGVVFAVSGAVTGSLFEVVFGVFAAVLGGFGLWWDHRESSDET
ncbi:MULTISPECIES: hypothetical protein [unclassified Halorubrum]|uniref:hypothetical protein n=1 Tax=unclassified Halorubrum TaxID=2642239 RepID=UPI0013038D85|nr:MULTISPECIES: hypothetical protein [unclassified Halorubrum]